MNIGIRCTRVHFAPYFPHYGSIGLAGRIHVLIYTAPQLIAVLKHIHLDEPSFSLLQEKDLFFNSSSSNFGALWPVAYIIHQ